MTKGIDISYVQNKVDFEKVKKDGFDFVIIRAGYGKYLRQKDNMFESHYAGAKAAGLKVGCYWYSYATDVNDAKLEAEIFLEVIKGKQFEYPLCFDIEEERQRVLGRTAVSNIASVFCHTVENAGYYVAIYSYVSFLRDFISENLRKRFDIWVAHTGVVKPNYSDPFGMWQFSHTGSVAGIKGNVCLEYAYKNYPEIIKSHNLNGFNGGVTKQQYREYIVKRGDSFWRIAENELGKGSRYTEILELNNMISSEIIYPNQVLKIPTN
ncbi:MAG: LysM peptidoglycan-binding domain-containing protein [Clostridiales bacterium]|nr:LysM peptidoglycan-binding domain-containing protein [Clostridiales bacterium]